MSKQEEVAIPQEVLMSKIHEIRGLKVMLDRDLAELPSSSRGRFVGIWNDFQRTSCSR